MKTKKTYCVNVLPHHYFFGLPSSPEVKITVDEISHNLIGFPVKSRQCFDASHRDLFKVISETNKFFDEKDIDESQVEWPSWCKYVSSYKE